MMNSLNSQNNQLKPSYQGEALDNVKYDKLDRILEAINVESVKMDKGKFVEKFRKVMDVLIKTMKLDKGFSQIYDRIGYTGSFYDGVRVKEATEFDLNLILKFNTKMDFDTDCKPGFIGITVDAGNLERPYKDWIVGGSLSPVKVMRWLQGVVDKSLNAMKNTVEDCQIRCSKSGPAITLIIKPEESNPISVDLVPVLEFPSFKWPPNFPKKSKKILKNSFYEPWFAVPAITKNYMMEQWRVSFPIQERAIIADQQYLKYTMRLVKKVRDELDMKEVASYYVKTMFLWELETYKDKDIWRQARRGRLFMHMLMRFKTFLEAKKLSSYWAENLNLFAHIKDVTKQKYHGTLNNFIKQINNKIDKPEELEAFIRRKLKSTNNGCLLSRSSSSYVFDGFHTLARGMNDFVFVEREEAAGSDDNQANVQAQVTSGCSLQ